MTTYLLPPEPITTLDAWLATDAGGSGVETAMRLGPAATIDVIARLCTAHDDATPNANAIMISNLVTLGSLTAEPAYFDQSLFEFESALLLTLAFSGIGFLTFALALTLHVKGVCGGAHADDGLTRIDVSVDVLHLVIGEVAEPRENDHGRDLRGYALF